MPTADYLIEALRLSPHEEGGWFRRTYESEKSLQVDEGSRSLGTSILYLLKSQEVSRLHSLRSDETWYFHQGNPVRIHSFREGQYRLDLLGNSWANSEMPQRTLCSGTIFGADSSGDSGFSLVSCSVTPGFDYADFSWPNVDQMLADYPLQEDLIRMLAPPPR